MQETEELRQSRELLEGARKKGGFNLLAKLLLAVMTPLIVISVFSVLFMNAVGKKTAEHFMEDQLAAAQNEIELCLGTLSDGDYRMEEGTLFKGEAGIEDFRQVLEGIGKNLGIEISLYWDKELALSTGEGKSFEISDRVSEVLNRGEGYYNASARVGGREAYIYLRRVGDGESSLILMTSKEAADVSKIYDYTVRTATVWLLVIIVLCVLLIVGVVLLISKALVSVVGNLDRVAEGELNFKLPEKLTNRSDEVGRFSRAIHAVITGFSQIVSGIHCSVQEMDRFTGKFAENFDSIGESIDSANKAVNEIAEGVSCQASDTQSVSESLSEMGKAINKTTHGVGSLNSNAMNMEKDNELVDETLRELTEISARTQRSVDEVQRQTNLTNESVQAIQAAADIIAGIASQTNLLSLNASIEAARAGEMGQGFAVVAQEIRGLADQSRESTDRIRGIVDTLISNSNHTVEIMDEVVGEIARQNEKLQVTRDVFENLNGEVQQVVDSIGEISGQIEHIARYKDGVLESIEELNQISQSNAAGTEETAAAMEQLSRVVEECRQATGQLVRISEDLTSSAKLFKL